MASDPKLDLLHSTSLFAKLKRHDLERVGALADEVDLPANHVLMRQGDRGSEMYVLARGKATVERDGRRLRDLGPGSAIGEMSLLSEGPRTATVTLTEPSQLFVLAHREFHTLLDEMPSMRLAILESVAEKLRNLDASTPH
jgi:CRP-like cAMP-binding protein